MVRPQNNFVFIFTNLIQIKEKTYMPVTVHVLFSRMGCFPYTPFLWQTKIKEHVSFESWKRRKLLLEQFSVKFMLPAQSIALAIWFACVPACTSTIAWVSLTSKVKADLHLKAKFNKTIIVFIMEAIVH